MSPHLLCQACALAAMLFLSAGCRPFTPALASGSTPLIVPRAVLPPRLDADPSDPVWGQAVSTGRFGAARGAVMPAEAPVTEAFLLWDEQNLYIRFVVEDRELRLPFPGQERDRDFYKGDVVELFLDPIGDGHSWLEMQVSPENGLLDQFCSLPPGLAGRSQPSGVLEGDFAKQVTFDRVWNLAGLRTATRTQKRRGENGAYCGWITDIAIPAELLTAFAMTERAFRDGMTLRANLLRYEWVPSANADAAELLQLNWQPVQKGCPHISPAAMGSLLLSH